MLWGSTVTGKRAPVICGLFITTVGKLNLGARTGYSSRVQHALGGTADAMIEHSLFNVDGFHQAVFNYH